MDFLRDFWYLLCLVPFRRNQAWADTIISFMHNGTVVLPLRCILSVFIDFLRVCVCHRTTEIIWYVGILVVFIYICQYRPLYVWVVYMSKYGAYLARVTYDTLTLG
jgi:hypothetical protein